MTDVSNAPTRADLFLSDEWVRAWRTMLEDSVELALVGRWTTLTLDLRCGDRRRTFGFDRGVLAPENTPTAVAADGTTRPASEVVVLDGAPRAWDAFLQSVPPPLHNDVLALDRRQSDFDIADGRRALIRNLRFIQLVLALARTASEEVEHHRG